MKHLAATLLALLLAAPGLAGQEHRLHTPVVSLLSVRTTAWTDPCPPEPEPCHRGDPRFSSAMYLGISVAGGALLGGAITAIGCQALQHKWRRRGKPEEEKPCSERFAYTVFTGAAIGALVGLGVGNFLYDWFEGSGTYVAPPSVDLVTFRVPIGFGR